MNKQVLDLLNFQINREFYSAYLYRALANHFEHEGLAGFAHWYNIQATEEKEHAILMMQYVLDNGGKVVFDAVEAPPADFADYESAVKIALDHEKLVTSYIHKIYSAALKAEDYRAMKFLDFFVSEQGEEEKNAEDLLRKVQLLGKDGQSLYILDKELAARPYTPIAGIRSGVN